MVARFTATVVAQFTAKTTNSEKAIYFLSLMYCSINKLSLMYCSINKLKSHMLFTCKNFMFSNFTWKKKFCSRKWWGIPDPSFLYGPVTCNKLDLMMKLDSIKYLKHPVNLQDTVQKLPPEVFYKKDAVTNFAKFTGKHLCQSLFLNKVADLRLRHRCFHVNFQKFRRQTFLQNTSEALLLTVWYE